MKVVGFTFSLLGAVAAEKACKKTTWYATDTGAAVYLMAEIKHNDGCTEKDWYCAKDVACKPAAVGGYTCTDGGLVAKDGSAKYSEKRSLDGTKFTCEGESGVKSGDFELNKDMFLFEGMDVTVSTAWVKSAKAVTVKDKAADTVTAPYHFKEANAAVEMDGKLTKCTAGGGKDNCCCIIIIVVVVVGVLAIGIVAMMMLSGGADEDEEDDDQTDGEDN